MTIVTANLRAFLTEVRPVAIVAILCWISIVVCLDPAGSYPNLPEGPGLTVDEIFNVSQGAYLVEQSRRLGWLNLIPGTSQEAYRPENGYNPDHPPLGRWWLGIHHLLTWYIAPPFEPDGPIATACARTGSATAFALTMLLVGFFATVYSGRTIGVMTAISLALMPRVYGHAHLASLETITNLTCTAAALGVVSWWSGPTLPNRRVALFTGAMLGLALLTKIQGVLIPIPIICWAFWRWQMKAFWPLLLWAVTAFLVFVVGWPYLWFDSVSHLLEYLGRTTNRATLQVWYFGEKYPDKLVPWHYPFVICGLTVPCVLHALGILGLVQSLWSRRRSNSDCVSEELQLISRPRASVNVIADSNSRETQIECNQSRDVLLLLCLLFPMVVFALPGVAVYDGERLFLTVFPFWAIFIGRGWGTIWLFTTRWSDSRRLGVFVWSILFVLAGLPLITMAPCHLCYYNEIPSLFMGGVERAGLEIDYWGEGVTRRLLRRLVEEVPEGATVAVIPTLHQFQAEDYLRQSPILRSHKIKVAEFKETTNAQQFLLVFRRRADLPAKWNLVKADDILGSTIRNHRLLAYYVQLDDINSQATTDRD